MSLSKIRKTVIINRAVPGSGKTTISRCIAQAVKTADLNAAIHSTDDYFLTSSGTYDFIPEKLGEYHQKNLDAFCADIKKGIDVVINDNTNLSSWQSEPYIEAGRNAGYQIIVIEYEPRSLDEHVESQILTENRPDAHGVPKETIIKMISDYHEFKKSFPEHYNADFVIKILPHEFHSTKKSIGGSILNLIKG